MNPINPKDFFISEIARVERYLDVLQKALCAYMSLHSIGKVGEDGADKSSDPPAARRAHNRPIRHKMSGKWATPPIDLTSQVERIIKDLPPGEQFVITDIFCRLKGYSGEKEAAVKGRISTILGRFLAKPERATFTRAERGVYIKKG